MIPLTRHTHYEPPTNLSIRRLLLEGIFEPIQNISSSALFFNAIVDTGSPYVIVPHSVHKHGIKIYQDLGTQPYKIGGQSKIFQPFAEIGFRFLLHKPVLAYHPLDYLRVKACLLEPNILPRKAVIGLDAIEQHFTLYVPPPPKDALLLEAGDAIP